MRWLALSAAVVFAAIVLTRSSDPVSAQAPAAADGILQFRISVGLADAEGKQWAGRIRVTGGELAGVEGWRFSQRDRVSAAGAFEFDTRVANFENQLRTTREYGQTDWNDPDIRRVVPSGLILRVRGSENTRIEFASGEEAFDFTAASVPFGVTLSRLSGNAAVIRMPAEERVSEAGVHDDDPAITFTADGQRWITWLAFDADGDYVMARSAGEAIRLTDKGDHHAPSIAADSRGLVHVAWSQREEEEWHIYMASRAGGVWSRARRMTQPGSSNIWPRLVSDGDRRLALVWQSLRGGRSSVFTRVWEGPGWGAEKQLNEDGGNAWAPSAAFGGGKLWFAWDSYSSGAYQIYVREWPSGPVERVTRGALYSARPSIAVTADGMPVVAWEESDALWGKDFAFLADRAGTTLYKNRRVRVARRGNGGWLELASPVEAIPAAIRRFVYQPHLIADAGGRLHLGLRVRTSATTSRMDYWAAGGVWEAFVTTLAGGRWTPAVNLPSSVGRNGMRMSLAASGGRLHLAWPTDRRAWPAGRYGDLDILSASLPVSGEAARLSGGQPIADAPAPSQPHADENGDIRRIRGYRVASGGKTYRILRGDLHRHTELSGDGAGEGSLDDLYRYALDAAQMDYAHVADHQMGGDEPYNWWIAQKSNDLYFMPGRFTPLYGYERSVPFPNGHRNVIWAERGKPVLKISEEERTGRANTGAVLFPYLRFTNGIATSHTSATQQGTDWRDNDPAVEPLVEIYQGFESSYEHEGAPRAWKEGEKTVHQGMKREGFVWNAWAKGYKLGVQASSDHVSTHTSFACILAEDFSRQGLLDAMRKRRTYAATDAIIVDFRARVSGGEALMGDITASSTAPKLAVKVIGTAPIRQIDVIKNNKYAHKVEPNSNEASFEFSDADFGGGESYYYVRVEQADGELAWSSPIWVTRRQ
jgi:hypothetical protein